MLNAKVLEVIADGDFQTELAQFNVEINVAPRSLEGDVFGELERDVRTSLNNGEEKARGVGAHMVMVGILPTVTDGHLDAESFSANPRYQLLNEQIFAARGEDLDIRIAGVERLSTFADTITPEAACTSVQLHLQVDPSRSGRTGTPPRRSPASSSRWPPTRRSSSARSCGARRASRCSSRRPTRARRSCAPRACARACGSGSAGSPRSSTSSRRTSATSRRCCRCARTRTRSRCSRAATSPALPELRLHNGTIYRWNRPIYDTVRGLPHLRVENRVLPAGPTVTDILANAAFYYGLLRALVDQDRPLWSQMSFAAAEENFHAGARDGIEANVYWPGVGEVPVAELVLRRLLPMAHEGLETWGVGRADRERLLGIVEQRCLKLTNGAAWQAAAFHRLYEDQQARPRGRAAGDDRPLPRAHALQRACAYLAVGLTLLLAGCGGDGGGGSDDEGLKVRTVATGLEIPWEIAFLPDGRALVTERPAGCGCSTRTGGCDRSRWPR